jgi:4,5-DOPA dioxygenase extradiol
MHRRGFVKTTGMLVLSNLITMSKLSALEALVHSLPAAEMMPALFIGHGSPMNAITDNSFHKSWQELGKTLPRPKAILSISAHWLTKGTKVTTMAQPKTIHDFGGFPKALFDQQYPAPGAPQTAQDTIQMVHHTPITGDDTWGLDHGTWSVLLPMYPAADIPVYQLGLDYNQPMSYHYEIGQQLLQLRQKGVLVIGSGNLVHNLQALKWEGDNKVYDWAQEFDATFTKWMDAGDHASLLNYQKIMGNLATMAHPTYDHLLPLYYILGLQQKGEAITYFNQEFDMASISMRSMIINKA